MRYRYFNKLGARYLIYNGKDAFLKLSRGDQMTLRRSSKDLKSKWILLTGNITDWIRKSWTAVQQTTVTKLMIPINGPMNVYS